MKAKWKNTAHGGTILMLGDKVLGSTSYGVIKGNKYVARTSEGGMRAGFATQAEAQEWVVAELRAFARAILEA